MIIPIEFDSQEISDFEDTLVQFMDARFTKDFGVFNEGELVPILAIDYDEGIVAEYSEDGKVIREQKFKAVSIE